jgi:hypothetical protein
MAQQKVDEEMGPIASDNNPLVGVCTDEMLAPGEHIGIFASAKKHGTTSKAPGEEGRPINYCDITFDVKGRDGHLVQVRASAPFQSSPDGSVSIRKGTELGSLAAALFDLDPDDDLPPALDFRTLIGKQYKIVASYAIKKDGKMSMTKAKKKIIEVQTILGLVTASPAPSPAPVTATKPTTPAPSPAPTPTPEPQTPEVPDTVEVIKAIYDMVGSGLTPADFDKRTKMLAEMKHWTIPQIELVASGLIKTGKMTIAKDGEGIWAKEMVKVHP